MEIQSWQIQLLQIVDFDISGESADHLCLQSPLSGRASAPSGRPRSEMPGRAFDIRLSHEYR